MGSHNSDTAVRLVHQGKRRRLDIVPFGITDIDFVASNGTMDEDYRRYLCELSKSGSWREHVASENSDGNEFDDDDDEEEDDEDPEYKSFLANLKRDGNFYALQVVVDDCTPLYLKYHDDLSDDEIEFLGARTSRKVPEKEQMGYKRNLWSDIKRDVEKIKKNVPGKDKREIQKSMNNLLGKDKREIHRSTTNVLSKDKKEIQKYVTDVPSKGKREIQKGGTNHLSKDIRGSLKETDKAAPKGHHGSGKKPGGYSQKPTPHSNKSFMTESCYEQEAEIGKRRSQRSLKGHKHEDQGDKIDGCYKYFLDHLYTEGDCLVFKTNNRTRVRYEEQDDDSSDSEVLVASNYSDLCKGTPDHFESSRPSIVVGGNGRQCRVDASRSDCSEFRKKLMEKLRQPYDQVEYKKLKELLEEKKYKVRHRDLRGGASTKTFLTDECSDSYLKHYATLKKKIDAVESNRHKVLNLMRGFFFWLENVPHTQKFQPWLDDESLKVLPGSR